MTEKRAIIMAAGIGGLMLLLMIVVVRPFSRFEREYPMAAVSGSAISGGGTSVDPSGAFRDERKERYSTGGTDGNAVTGADGDASISASGASATLSDFIDPSGATMETRIIPPEGYIRTMEESGSIGDYLRTYKLKKDGAPVLLYDKSKKANQNAHVAVFKFPLEKEDLQQCADSVMRVYAEYFLATDQVSRIAFSLGGGFKAEYSKWIEGYRIVESGDTYELQDMAEYDDSYDNFKKFMRIVFAYSGTYSLEEDSEKININELKIGDIFVNSGSPGHAVMVVDMCENEEGNKAFLLAQGYMPAEQFHILKNPAHEDPWYYVDEVSFPFETPEYTFEKKKSIRRVTY